MNELLKKYIGDVDNLSKYEYLEIVFDTKSGPGLSDQIFQLKMYLKIAYELGLILILPKRNLSKRHNNGVWVPLVFSEYYDINSIKVDGKVVNVVTSISESSYDKVLQINYLKRGKYINLDYEVVIELCKDDVEFVREFVELNKIEGCVHVRRTDRCNPAKNNSGISGHDWDIANRPKSILSMLDGTNAPRNIYIMTDMPSDDSIIEELRNQKKYNFMFLYDFPELVEIKNKNNYKVFNIETCIMKCVGYRKSKGGVVKFYINSQNRT